MKERIKSFLLHFLIIYILFVLITSIYTLITYSTTIKLSDTKENINLLNKYKSEADTILNDNACHKSIKNMISFYEKTSYNGIIDRNNFDFSWNAKTPISMGSELVANCDIYRDRFNEENIIGKIVASSLLFEEVFYMPNQFKYEISFKDIFSRELYEGNIINAEYNSERKLELEIIKELLEIVKEDEVSYEE